MAKKSLFFNDSMFSTRLEREIGGVPLETRRRVRRGVFIAHAGVLLLPLAWYLISSLFSEPRLKTIKVSIVSPSSSSSSSPIHPVFKHQKRAPRISRPKKQHRETARKVRKAPGKPKWKPRKASQIKVSGKVVKASSVTRDRNLAPPKTLSAAEIEERLKSAASRSVHSSAASIPNTVSGGGVSRNYREKLYSAIYALWRQPSKAELNGLCPSTDISFTVNASGAVSNPRISRKSGNSAMDASVRRLIRDLRALPPPPRGRMSFTVTLEIVER
jgi:TonB family protein